MRSWVGYRNRFLSRVGISTAFLFASIALGTIAARAVALRAPDTRQDMQKPSDIPVEAHKIKDPLPKSRPNTLAGAGVFQENCSGCHGPQGVPVRRFANLERQPATLTSDAMKNFSDGDLAWILQHGAPGGMPSFADDLSESQRWQCIQFVRRLGKDSVKYTAQYTAQHPAAAPGREAIEGPQSIFPFASAQLLTAHGVYFVNGACNPDAA